MDRPLTLTDVEALANERLDPDWREYFAGGAGDERALRDNVAAFRAWHLRQRVLCGTDTARPRRPYWAASSPFRSSLPRSPTN